MTHTHYSTGWHVCDQQHAIKVVPVITGINFKFQNEMVSKNICCFDLFFDMETPESRGINHLSWQIVKLEAKEDEEWHTLSLDRVNDTYNTSLNLFCLP